MKTSRSASFQTPIFALLDEALDRLRREPTALLLYFVGTLPFVLGFLTFWLEMSQGSDAFVRRNGVGAALGLAALYVWMKGWQSLFAAVLQARISGGTPERWTFPRLLRLFVRQGIVQATGFLLLPLAALVLLPFGQLHAFYQNAAVLDDGRRAPLSASIREAWRLGGLWPMQNHLLIWLLSPLLLVSVVATSLGLGYLVGRADSRFENLGIILAVVSGLPLCPLGMILFANFSVLLFLLPYAAKALFGIESPFTLGGEYFLNSTFLMIVGSLAFMALDPLMKAAYVLRCFQGRSIRSGEDLLLRFRARDRGGKAGKAAVAALLAVVYLAPIGARADAPPPAPSEEAPRSEIFGKAIARVLDREEFAWRLPHEESSEVGRHLSFLDAAEAWIKKKLEPLRGTVKKAWAGFQKGLNWLDRGFSKWLRHLFKENTPDLPGNGGPDWAALTRNAIYVVAGLSLALLAWLAYRRLTVKATPFAAAASGIVRPLPDLHDEATTAADLPVDEWFLLARDLEGRGEYRLALRARYFSVLALLAEAKLIRIVRSKSNRDYLAEVAHRLGAPSEKTALFRENVALYERSWYGTHPVTPAELALFEANRLRMAEETESQPPSAR